MLSIVQLTTSHFILDRLYRIFFNFSILFININYLMKLQKVSYKLGTMFEDTRYALKLTYEHLRPQKFFFQRAFVHYHRHSFCLVLFADLATALAPGRRF